MRSANYFRLSFSSFDSLFFGTALVIIGFVDIILSWVGFDLARRVGMGRLSYFAPYALIALGFFITN